MRVKLKATTVESEVGSARNCDKEEAEETMSCQTFLQEQHVKSLQGHSCVSCHISKHVGSISPLTGKLSEGSKMLQG